MEVDMDSFELQLFARMALAAGLGFLVGWEREIHGSHAGDRTHSLVALGAAAFTGLSVELFRESSDKVIAGVVTGMGFLGAGVIMREGGAVRGLTTAAGLWAVAAVGVLVGAGQYVGGMLMAALILTILSWERLPLLSRIGIQKERWRLRTRSDREDSDSS
jgi:putative Mg2+ transporter-C (MgtC) family protein